MKERERKIAAMGLFWLILAGTLLIVVALIISFIPLSWFPVRGTLRYEYHLSPLVTFWNMSQPIDANSDPPPELLVGGSPTYEIMEKNFASANAEYLHVKSSFHAFYVSIDGIDGVELLWSNHPPRSGPYTPHPRLLLGHIVELLNAGGWVNGNYTIHYKIWIMSLYAYVSGPFPDSFHSPFNPPPLEITRLWIEESEYTLAKVCLLVQDGKITSISNNTYPLEITAPIQLYNPILVNARKWLPPILLVAAVLVNTKVLAELYERKKLQVTH